MAVFGKLPKDAFAPKKTEVVAALGAPGRGPALALHAPKPDEPGDTLLRVLRFDDALDLVEDRSAHVSRERPLAGGAWPDGRPVVFFEGRRPVACDELGAEDDWLDRASDALASPWFDALQGNLPKPGPPPEYHKGRGQPKAGAVLTSGWLMGAGWGLVQELWLVSLEGGERRLVSMASNDPEINRARSRLVPRTFTQLVAAGADRFAFVGSEVVRGKYYAHKLGVYDVATDALVIIERPPWRADRATLVFDGRSHLVLSCEKVVYRYDLTLSGPPEVVSVAEAPSLASWVLLGGNVVGQTLWLNRRKKVLCRLDASDLHGDDLAGCLEALTRT